MGRQATPPFNAVTDIQLMRKILSALLFTLASHSLAAAKPDFDPAHVYTLSELIDYAESHNPETRVAWERAKQAAAEVGVARAALFPTVAVAALAQQSRNRVLFGDAFFTQDVTVAQPALNLYYTILDFGARRAGIETAQAGLLAARFGFTNTHRVIIYGVTAAYYRLNSALSQIAAAHATLVNAQTVQQAVEARLNNGFATRPDVLEARAAAAQASYELATVQGEERLAVGQLAQVLDVDPTLGIQVQGLDNTPNPMLSDSAQVFIERALQQRPDLLAQATRITAAEATIRSARSQYFPKVTFSGAGADQYQRGEQPPNPPVSENGTTWQATLSASWTLFDGRARYNELDRARSERRQAEAELAVSRSEVTEQVWAAYSNVQTTLERQGAADALLAASQQSYDATLAAFKYGVKSLLDVVSAERVLAQARTAQVQTQAEVLTSFAQLAFATGDIVPLKDRTQP